MRQDGGSRFKPAARDPLCLRAFDDSERRRRRGRARGEEKAVRPSCDIFMSRRDAGEKCFTALGGSAYSHGDARRYAARLSVARRMKMRENGAPAASRSEALVDMQSARKRRYNRMLLHQSGRFIRKARPSRGDARVAIRSGGCKFDGIHKPPPAEAFVAATHRRALQPHQR